MIVASGLPPRNGGGIVCLCRGSRVRCIFARLLERPLLRCGSFLLCTRHHRRVHSLSPLAKVLSYSCTLSLAFLPHYDRRRVLVRRSAGSKYRFRSSHHSLRVADVAGFVLQRCSARRFVRVKCRLRFGALPPRCRSSLRLGLGHGIHALRPGSRRLRGGDRVIFLLQPHDLVRTLLAHWRRVELGLRLGSRLARRGNGSRSALPPSGGSSGGQVLLGACRLVAERRAHTSVAGHLLHRAVPVLRAPSITRPPLAPS